MAGDLEAIDAVVRTFFSAFDSARAPSGSLDRLPEIFAPDARIAVLDAAGELRTYGVAEFIAPRRELLLRGAVTEFREWETEGETLLGRDIACRRCRYEKAGVRDGAPFTGRGTKMISFVRSGDVWKITSLLWQDDP